MVYPKVVMLGAVCGNFREKTLRGQWSLMWKLAHFDGTCQQNPSPKKTTKNCVCQQKKHHIFSISSKLQHHFSTYASCDRFKCPPCCRDALKVRPVPRRSPLPSGRRRSTDGICTVGRAPVVWGLRGFWPTKLTNLVNEPWCFWNISLK